MVAVTPVIITGKPEPLPFVIVKVVPFKLEVPLGKFAEAAFTETIVPPFYYWQC